LASSSPRRRELLGALGLAFVVDPPGIPEPEPDHLADEAAVAAWVAQLARSKAAAVAGAYAPDHWVLGADTTVVLGNRVFGKPRDRAEAVEMILALQGRTHAVLTAVALMAGGAADGEVTVVRTGVTFYPCSRAQAEAYVAAGESLDKAGAYAAQGRGALIIERLDGCYFNVVGLPLATVARLLGRVGFDLWRGGEGR
jgi:septum formation protein